MHPAFDSVRQALRALRRTPGFTLTAVLTVALGVGAPTAMFTVVNGVVLKPLPYPQEERLVRVWSAHPRRGLPFFSASAPDVVDWATQALSFETLGAFERPQAVAWTGGDEPEELQLSRVTAAIFDVLAMPPRIGRTFSSADGPDALVLGHGLWQRRFGGDPAILGRALALDGQPYTVVGVMPQRFAVPGSSADAWAPLDLRAGDDRARRFLRVLGRIRPGVSPDAARAELEGVAARLQELHPDTNAGWSVTVRPLRETVVGRDLRHALLMLLGVVALVLVIASANVAHLVLVRGAVREREMAVRAALGAGRRRLVGQLLVESVVITIAGGALGLLVTAGSIDALRAAGPAGIPRLDDLRIDARVLAFAALASLVAAALFGLLPALQGSRAEAMARALRESRAAVGGGPARLRGAIVGLEVALAVVVTTGSLLLVRSLQRLEAVDPGFEARGVIAVPLAPAQHEYEGPTAVVAFYDAVLEKARGLPGVVEASLVTSAPFSGPNSANLIGLEGQLVERKDAPDADFRLVAPGYFRALRIPLLRGSDFDPRDRADGPPVAIVNETMAQRFWPGRDAIGRRFRMGDIASGPWITVVGVVGNALYRDLEATEPRPMLYLPHAAAGERSMTLVVRAAPGSFLGADSLRRAVWSVNKSVPVPEVESLEHVLSLALAERRFNASLFALFAALAVALAAIGVYGVMAHFVALRRPEIAIRVALGASPRAVAAFVLRRGGAAAAAGLVGGIAGALLLGPALRSLLYGVSPGDPGTIAAVAGFFGVVTAVAAWGPARRAIKLDPVQVLREG